MAAGLRAHLQLAVDEGREGVVEKHDVAVAEKHIVARLQQKIYITRAATAIQRNDVTCSTRIRSRGFLRTMALNSSLPKELRAINSGAEIILKLHVVKMPLTHTHTHLLRVDKSVRGALPWSP